MTNHQNQKKNIKDIKSISSSDIDGLILPGGSGPIKDLSNFAENGADATVHPKVVSMI